MNEIQIDLNGIELNQFITHFIAQEPEQSILSDQLSQIVNNGEAFFLKYLVLPLKQEELFHLSLDSDLYRWTVGIFEELESLKEQSHFMAKKLSSCSSHHAVKEGFLNVAHFEQLEVNGEQVDALGIFKTESDEVFLKILRDEEKGQFVVGHEYGYPLNALDKGCLILNYQKEDGFVVLMLDKAKTNEAQYWKNDFLELKAIQNSFTNTNDWISLTKSFVQESLVEETLPTERIEIMNRAAGYFQDSSTFKQDEFEASVLIEEPVIQSFRNYNNNYRLANETAPENEFEISAQAVKKKHQVFKSVLKLDKNFHVYVHGNRNKIERGVEPDGRKFYKLYYDEES